LEVCILISRPVSLPKLAPGEGTMANENNTGKPGYKGSERRRFSRRLTAERRKDIRWEPNNPNRRQSTGRRAADHLGVLGSKR
jgi:hypothetical protein